MSVLKLNAQNALLFRIVHRANFPWIVQNGLHSRTSNVFDPNYRNIRNLDLIDRRALRRVEVGPGGVLNDYVPFYFTPYSIMMLNIKTGYGGVTQQKNEDILILVSSIPKFIEAKIPFVFTNQHAFPVIARYFTDPANLNFIDWACLQARDFKHNPEDPGKKERYQAEGLAWKHVPLSALLGICCYNQSVEAEVTQTLTAAGKNLSTVVRPTWYF